MRLKLVVLTLSRVENRALRQLVEDKGLVVAKEDKGDSIVMFPTSRYLELAYKHLRDNKTCKLLHEDPTQKYTDDLLNISMPVNVG